MNNVILTKKAFWEPMRLKYPLGMEYFKEWIDKYKVTNNWDYLFNDNTDDPFPRAGTPTITAPKYHELPIAMQLGIFNEFLYNQELIPSFLQAATPENYEWCINLVISCIDAKLNKSKL